MRWGFLYRLGSLAAGSSAKPELWRWLREAPPLFKRQVGDSALYESLFDPASLQGVWGIVLAEEYALHFGGAYPGGISLI